MQALQDYLRDHPTIYVSRDIMRAEGFDFSLEGLFLLTNDTPEAQKLQEAHPESVTLIKGDIILDTVDILKHPDAKEILDEKSIFVFKNSSRIERICKENNWKLINPSAELGDTVERKTTQSNWLDNLNQHLPDHQVIQLKDVLWTGTPFVVHFNTAHSGEGIHLLSNENELKELQQAFPEREVRQSNYIEGMTFTSNPVVATESIIFGNISYQITGLKPFTDLPFASIGNDWALPNKLLSKKQIDEYHELEQSIGEKLQQDGWRGMFGIDVVLDADGEWHLIEINARQTAGASTESKLQKTNTILETHLASMLGLTVNKITPLTSGGQIITRATKDKHPDKKHNEVVSSIIKEDYIMDEHNVIRPDIYTKNSNHSILSENAHKVIDAYKKLNVAGCEIKTPYRINTRGGVKGGLNVYVGKGSPEEIKEEVDTLLKKAGNPTLTPEELTKLLVEKQIGIDCSGFVYHVLKAEYPNLKLRFPYLGLLRKIRTSFVPERFADVKTFAHESNSTPVVISDVQAGDIITMVEIDNEVNHVLLIHEVREGTIHYTHSVPWFKDGKYGHGVREGVITITDPNKPLGEQMWEEAGHTREENETLGRFKKSESAGIRRLIQ